jgi:hypothetical protein
MSLTPVGFWVYTALVASGGVLVGAMWAGRRRENEIVELFRSRIGQSTRRETTPVLHLSTQGATGHADDYRAGNGPAGAAPPQAPRRARRG